MVRNSSCTRVISVHEACPILETVPGLWVRVVLGTIPGLLSNCCPWGNFWGEYSAPIDWTTAALEVNIALLGYSFHWTTAALEGNIALLGYSHLLDNCSCS